MTTELAHIHETPLTPAAMDRHVVSSAQRFGVVLDVQTDYRVPRDSNGNMLDAVITVKGCSVSGDPEAVPRVLEGVKRSLEPATTDQIEGWLAELSVIVARRMDDDMTEELRLYAYTKRLAKYPADVAHEALLGRSWRFFPSWHELEEICDKLSARRRAMLNALERYSPPREPDPLPEPPSEESRAAMAALVAEAFPSIKTFGGKA